MKKIIFHCVVMMVISATCPAQVLEQTIQWTSGHATVAVGNSKSLTSVFTTNGENFIWEQPGKVTYTFSITGSSGSWTGPGSDGSIELSLSLGSRSSTAMISRVNGEIKISLTVPNGSGNVNTYEFSVDGYEIQ